MRFELGSSAWKWEYMVPTIGLSIHFAFTFDLCIVRDNDFCISCYKFWIDAWLGNQSLAVVFPPIFNLVRNQDETIHEVLARKLGSHSLDFDWEKDMVDDSLSILDSSDSLILDNSADMLIR